MIHDRTQADGVRDTATGTGRVSARSTEDVAQWPTERGVSRPSSEPAFLIRQGDGGERRACLIEIATT